MKKLLLAAGVVLVAASPVRAELSQRVGRELSCNEARYRAFRLNRRSQSLREASAKAAGIGGMQQSALLREEARLLPQIVETSLLLVNCRSTMRPDIIPPP